MISPLFLVLLSKVLLVNVSWTGNPYSGVLFGNYYYTLNLWNLNFAKGSFYIKIYDNYIFEIKSNLTNISLKNPYLTVVGYPSAIYGHSIWENLTTNEKYPIELFNISKIKVNIAYNIVKENCPMDIALDIWLTKSKSDKISSNDVELMIWLYKNQIHPRGRIMGYIHYKSINWSIWIDKGSWIYVAFVPSKNINNIKLNLKKFINYLIKNKILTKYYWLNDIESGVEFVKNKNNDSNMDVYIYFNVSQSTK